MAESPKSKGFKIRFELSLAGLFGVAVVCFCVFLWMFLLGVWAGQTGLISGMSFTPPAVIPVPAKVAVPARRSPPEPVVAPTPEPTVEAPPVADQAVPFPASASPVAEPPPVPVKVLESAAAPVTKAPEPPFYAIQVGAFRDQKNVEDELRVWHDRGYDSFSRPPGENEHLTKVYVGHYPDAATARKEEVAMVKKRKISPLIVMIRPD